MAIVEGGKGESDKGDRGGPPAEQSAAAGERPGGFLSSRRGVQQVDRQRAIPQGLPARVQQRAIGRRALAQEGLLGCVGESSGTRRQLLPGLRCDPSACDQPRSGRPELPDAGHDRRSRPQVRRTAAEPVPTPAPDPETKLPALEEMHARAWCRPRTRPRRGIRRPIPHGRAGASAVRNGRAAITFSSSSSDLAAAVRTSSLSSCSASCKRRDRRLGDAPQFAQRDRHIPGARARARPSVPLIRCGTASSGASRPWARSSSEAHTAANRMNSSSLSMAVRSFGRAARAPGPILPERVAGRVPDLLIVIGQLRHDLGCGLGGRRANRAQRKE